jgi:predicted TIM-barrel fold metal-dependent hydrolase
MLAIGGVPGMTDTTERDADEAVLEPDLEIIDAHHHLWDGTALVPGSGTYLLPEFLADILTGHRIRATVFVEVEAMYREDGPEALRPVGEVEFANGVAAMCASGRYGRTRVCAGIVGFADLCLGQEAVAVLEALIAAGNGRLRGIRHMGAADADAVINRAGRRLGLLQDQRFRAGFSQLAPLGLSFDAWQYHPQLADVVDLARAHPETTIVVDHTGGPLRIRGYAASLDTEYRDWKRSIERLAACPNVVMKLGGLGMRVFGLPPFEDRIARSQFLAAQWRPYIEPCIEAFGVGRCMFESNFPVDKPSCSYAVLWNAFKRLAAGSSAAEKAALFSDTAARVYRL